MNTLNQFREIKYFTRKNCIVCGNKNGMPLINLPQFPLTEIFVKQKTSEKLGFINQEFHLCQNCGQGQLKNVVDPNILYGNSYRTRTSVSVSAMWSVDVFLEFVYGIIKRKSIGTVVEIGCNDLYTLKKMKNRAQKLYGIDPIFKGRENEVKDKKIKVFGDLFENVDLGKIEGKIDLVISSHTLEHMDDPKMVIMKMLEKCSNEAILCFQFPGLESLVYDAHFDQIFHQHLNYFSVQSVIYLLNDLECELIDYKVNPYHWGSLMIAFKKRKKSLSVGKRKLQNTEPGITSELVLKQYKLFKEILEKTALRIDSYTNRKMYGYGAAMMFPVLEYYMHSADKFQCIIDEDLGKDSLYYLDVPIQVKHISRIKDLDKSVVVVTAINSLQTIRSCINKLIKLNAEKIILPVNLI
jgi:hypothetical protein